MRAYKTEIRLTPEQVQKVRQNIGVCRWLYNEFVAVNKQRHEAGLSFMSAFDFDKYINHEVKTLAEFGWIDECGAKARKKAICNAEAAFKRFFKRQGGFPKFKKRREQNVSLYFPKNGKGDWTIARNYLQVPTLKRVWLKEYGYLPVGAKVKSGTLSQKADSFFVSVLIDEPEREHVGPTGEGIGIDLGLKSFAVSSDGDVFGNINKSRTVKRIKRKLKRVQRRLSRKLKLKRGEKSATYSANVAKNVLEVQKINQRLNNIRRNFRHLVIAAIMKREPTGSAGSLTGFVTVEDLNVRGMMANRRLARAIGESNFYTFRLWLEQKCNEHGVEFRVADRYYASSKTCHECGCVKKDLTLRDRVYVCPNCGNVIDRDYQAALNLRDYKSA